LGSGFSWKTRVLTNLRIFYINYIQPGENKIVLTFPADEIFSFTFPSDFVYNLAKLAHAAGVTPVRDTGASSKE
jgi:hypothetical protein